MAGLNKILIIPLIFVVMVFYIKIKKNIFKALSLGVIYTLIMLFLISPWMIRNYSAVKNPVFPLFNSIFSTEIIKVDSELAGFKNEYATRLSMGESLFDLALIPLRFF